MTIYGEGNVTGFVDSNSSAAAKYQVKLPFGSAMLSPSAILFALQSKETPYVRRDGSMVRDPLPSNGADGATTLGSDYQLLFGTEAIYVFLRRYALVCSLLGELKQHCESSAKLEDPATRYITKDRQATVSSGRLDYASIVSLTEQCMLGKASPLEVETLARKVTIDRVSVAAALPKLVTRCGDYLIRAADEDVLLSLHDYCQFRQADPVVVRAHCFATAPKAFYRIQYDRSNGVLYFSYLPKSEELLLAPSDEVMDYDNEVNGVDDAVMMEDEDDPIEEYPEEAK